MAVKQLQGHCQYNSDPCWIVTVLQYSWWLSTFNYLTILKLIYCKLISTPTGNVSPHCKIIYCIQFKIRPSFSEFQNNNNTDLYNSMCLWRRNSSEFHDINITSRKELIAHPHVPYTKCDVQNIGAVGLELIAEESLGSIESRFSY